MCNYSCATCENCEYDEIHGYLFCEDIDVDVTDEYDNDICACDGELYVPRELYL